MGRMILCPHCGSTFNEDILKKRHSEDTCLACGESLLVESKIKAGEEGEMGPEQDESLNFGEGIKLGPYDSSDEAKMDFLWYDIIEPGAEGPNGLLQLKCTTCGGIDFVYYTTVVRCKDYFYIPPKIDIKCNRCGKRMRNRITSKIPEDWTPPEPYLQDSRFTPKCPICSSTNIRKLSVFDKAVTAWAWGDAAAGTANITYECNNCRARF